MFINNKVTVIIPCFNGANFVSDAIESVLSQNYDPIEVIAIDDGSTDNTINILNLYNNKINILRHPDNGNHGKAATLNFGLKHSSGKFVAFLDQDDIWLQGKIKVSMKLLLDDTNLGMVYTNGYWMEQDGTLGGEILPKEFQENNNPLNLLMDCYIKSATSAIIRRSVFREIGIFDEKLIGCDDHDMWLRVIEKFKIGYIKEPLYKYRLHYNQLSKDIRMWLGGFYVLNKACKRNGYGFNVKRKRLSVLYYRIGIYYINKDKLLFGIKNLIMSGLLDPVRAFIVCYKELFNK